jgi:hypothetical protein
MAELFIIFVIILSSACGVVFYEAELKECREKCERVDE